MQRNVELVRTIREVVGDDIDIMADAYMGWTLDYAKRMLPLLEPINLRWLEEAVIADDLAAMPTLKATARSDCRRRARVHASTVSATCLRARAVDYIQFDTNRVGGITQARKIAAMAEAFSVPVIPHAGQMHNFHVVMASLNSPMAEYFPVWMSRSATSSSGISSRASRQENGSIDLSDESRALDSRSTKTI